MIFKMKILIIHYWLSLREEEVFNIEIEDRYIKGQFFPNKKIMNKKRTIKSDLFMD